MSIISILTKPFQQVRDYSIYTFDKNPIISTGVLFITLILFIFIIQFANATPEVIDGKWSEWSTEKDCDKTCGPDGKKVEVRTCTAPKNKGKECDGENKRVVKCDLPRCPIDGGWGEWIDTSVCTEECGEKGVKTQKRICDNPTVSDGGKECKGDSVRITECNRTECPTKPPVPPIVNGGWSDWNISECTSTKNCGPGKITMTRTCDNPKPENGGTDCVGTAYKETDCNLKECAVDGGFGEWKLDTTSCSKECGTGFLKMRRECNNPLPKNGGKECTGEKEKDSTVICNTQKCPLSDVECNKMKKGPYPKECLQRWFNDVSCSNNQYIKEYPETYNGPEGRGWWHSQNSEIVKQDMRNWALNPFWGDNFKSICLPKNYQPTNEMDCAVSNSYWNKNVSSCDTKKSKSGDLKIQPSFT